MATTIRDLLVRLGVDADEKKIANFDKRLEGAKSTMFAITGVAVAAAGAVGFFVKSFADGADSVGKAAARIGVSAEELQEWEFAAGKTGASTEELRDGLKEVRKRLAEARTGSKETAAAFSKLGIDASKAQELTPVMNKIADAIVGVNSEAEKIRLADRIAGEAGVRLLPLLKSGAAGMEALRQQARESGGVISNELVAASEAFNDSLADAGLIVKRYRNRLAARLIPTLTDAVNRGRDWFLINRDIIDQRFDRAIELIGGAVDFVRGAFVKVNRFVRDEIGGWDVLFTQVGKVIAAGAIALGLKKLFDLAMLARAAVVAFGAAGAAAGGPFTAALIAIIGFFVSALLAAEDFVVFLQGGRSTIGQFLAAFGLEQEAREGLLAELAALQQLALAAFEAFRTFVTIFGPTQEEIAAVNSAIDALRANINTLIKAGLERWVKSTRGAVDEIEVLTRALSQPRDTIEDMVAGLDRFLKRIAQLRERMRGTTLGGFLAATPSGRLAEAGGRVSTGLLEGLVARAQRGLAATAGAAGPTTSSTSTTTVTQGGDNITIQTGADPQEVIDRLEERDRQKRVAALSTARGGVR